ncbi:MAG: hypothetical protein ABIH88_00360 [Patescibacteria group bacterium]
MTKTTATIPLAKKSLEALKKGERIVSGTDLFQEKLFEATDYDARDSCKIPLEDFLSQLFERLGKEVREGEALARVGKKIFLSPMSGILTSVTDDGVLKISKIKTQSFQFPFDCEIVKVKENEVEICFDGESFESPESYGEIASGILNFIDENVFLGAIDDVSGSIVVFKDEIPLGFWYKLLALGAIGFVVGSLSDILRKRLEEDSNAFGVIVFPVDSKDNVWEVLRKKNKSQAFFDPSTKILIIQ